MFTLSPQRPIASHHAPNSRPVLSRVLDGLKKVQRTFLLYELAGKQEHHSFAIDFPLGSQFISLWLPALRLFCEMRIVQRVRNDEEPLRASAVMQKILARQ